MKRKQIRTGMEVCSIYEPGRKFKIDKSIKGVRLFREKGSTRWYVKNQLLAFSEAQKGIRALTANILNRTAKERSLAIEGVKGGLSPQRQPEYRLTCDECGIEFTRKRKPRPGHAVFCSDAHRAMNWKRRNEVPKANG